MSLAPAEQAEAQRSATGDVANQTRAISAAAQAVPYCLTPNSTGGIGSHRGQRRLYSAGKRRAINGNASPISHIFQGEVALCPGSEGIRKDTERDTCDTLRGVSRERANTTEFQNQPGTWLICIIYGSQCYKRDNLRKRRHVGIEARRHKCTEGKGRRGKTGEDGPKRRDGQSQRSNRVTFC